MVTALRGHEENLDQTLHTYRMHVYHQGHEGHEARLPDGTTQRGALSHDAVLAVLAANGRLPLTDYLRCRVRYFCDGAVFGSRPFVNSVFNTSRDQFGPKRSEGARRLRGVHEKLYSLRDLRLRLFG